MHNVLTGDLTDEAGRAQPEGDQPEAPQPG